MKLTQSIVLGSLLLHGPSLFATERSLIVVYDAGGRSAEFYYRVLRMPPRQFASQRITNAPEPAPPTESYTEAHMLPVHSPRLRPGAVVPRVMNSPGLKPMFLVGDNKLSRAWLKERYHLLRYLGAVGFVVEVETKTALDDLRRHAPGLTLIPASGDDLAQRLSLDHYPVLITATGIEQ